MANSNLVYRHQFSGVGCNHLARSELPGGGADPEVVSQVMSAGSTSDHAV
jgi:hypothetical protein